MTAGLGETLEFDGIYVLLLLPLLLPTTTVDSHTIIDPLESNYWVEECKETEAGMSLFWVFFFTSDKLKNNRWTRN